MVASSGSGLGHSEWTKTEQTQTDLCPHKMTHMVCTSPSTCVSLVLHGNNGLDAGELLLIALLGQRPPLHGHPAASHPRAILITLRGEDGTPRPPDYVQRLVEL